MQLVTGSEAMAQASIAAGCRFYAAYPMTPATKLLDSFSKLMPEAGGICMHAESELEAVGMTWGALATGTRAAVGGCGQGLALMQESFSEMTIAELPLVAFNMARGQGDYFQSTRGGGHGDYRHVVLAPHDITEAVQLTALAFELADRWRNPVLVIGDYLLAHGTMSVDLDLQLQEAPPKPWAVTGKTSGSGNAVMISPYGDVKGASSTEALDPQSHHRNIYEKHRVMAVEEQRCEVDCRPEDDYVVLAWGSPSQFVRYAVRSLRDAGHRIGFVRPITLWPFPVDAIKLACAGRRGAIVFEANTGQMLEDVERTVAGSTPVRFIGEFSVDRSGFGIGPLLNADLIEGRIKDAMGDPR
jgi:2-oxoglutarate ferredoxin oxidoreductase subunit alpha